MARTTLTIEDKAGIEAHRSDPAWKLLPFTSKVNYLIAVALGGSSTPPPPPPVADVRRVIGELEGYVQQLRAWEASQVDPGRANDLRDLFKALAEGGPVDPGKVALICHAFDIPEEDVLKAWQRCQAHAIAERLHGGGISNGV